ncbi:MAG: hypothetical protein RMK89_03140 [Armatimonadota bacterium]|nr:hypothetical protein [Armatimonadota bacterium]MDW8142439.1 hypothetical protein [Armatimonadota bacterium]
MLSRAIVVVAALMLMAMAAIAQPPPQMMQQFQKFREEHKYHFQLRETFLKLGELEKKGGQTALTKDQAQKLLAIFQPLTKKEKLTADEAKEVLKKIKGILRADQLNALQRIQLPRMRRPGGGPGGPGGAPSGPGGAAPGGPGGGPGGPGGPGGGPRFDPSQLRNFNPLSLVMKVDPKSPMAEFAKRRAERIKEVLSLLEKKAKSK